MHFSMKIGILAEITCSHSRKIQPIVLIDRMKNSIKLFYVTSSIFKMQTYLLSLLKLKQDNMFLF